MKKQERDSVVVPLVKTTVRKGRSVLQANALKQDEQLPKTHVTKGIEMGPDQLVKKLCGIVLQVVTLVWGRRSGLMKGQLMNGAKG